jgi:hypothetical protein
MKGERGAAAYFHASDSVKASDQQRGSEEHEEASRSALLALLKVCCGSTLYHSTTYN